MKIRSLEVRTSYPRGYGSTDPRLVHGTVEVQSGPGAYHYEDVKLSREAIEKIVQIALDDFAIQMAARELSGPNIVFDEADLPPLPEPEPQEPEGLCSDEPF